MSAELVKILLPHLPRYAEEEGDFFCVPRDELISHLVHAAYPKEQAENTVAIVENLLLTLATLNTDALQKGDWCFISFPAQLMAMSVLTALSDPNSRLFAAHFWNTRDISSDKKNQQRDILNQFETARLNHHTSAQAVPIRYCYVAWSIIKLDGKILFYQREDTQKRHDKRAGDYGLMGGRANQNDIPLVEKNMLLKALQSPRSEIIQRALPTTLQRELREEAELLFDEHYTFHRWRRLAPYQQVQGAAPNHALTEYYLDIFQIDLTLAGYLHLQHKVQTDERLVWFTIDDMIQGATVDGKIPYIKALYDDFSGDRTLLATELKALPESFTNKHHFQPKKYGLTLPLDCNEPIMAGVLGKEKPLDLKLSVRQLQLLLGLAAHLRDFEFVELDENITLHPFGWFEITKGSALKDEFQALADLVNQTDLVIENYQDQIFRLSITPNAVSFDVKLFSFIVEKTSLTSVQSKIPISIQRKSFTTAMGDIKEKAEGFKISIQSANDWKSLSETHLSTEREDAVKIEDTYKKGLHKDLKFLALGLRGLIRRDSGMIKFNIRYVSQ